ncbi:hypothetical protein AVEN_225191-1 [Araneus ventricosus]|uniref:Uncharacterized protein n=1 Tax=Araneus ventricosus TaxID=182803 RepID=A0A4Y2AKV9_ARAVE|nr:hypothetical protein AVEN_225191-1 [Araneus ventricosus]
MALRVAFGLPKWTPNIVLMKIAGQEVLSEKLRVRRRVYRRNRKHLVPSPDFHPEPEPEDDCDVTDTNTLLPCPSRMSASDVSPQSPKTYPERD